VYVCGMCSLFDSKRLTSLLKYPEQSGVSTVQSGLVAWLQPLDQRITRRRIGLG